MATHGAEPGFELLAPSGAFSWDAANLILADLDQDGDEDLVHLPNGSTTSSGDPHPYWIENLGTRRFAPLRLLHVAPTGRRQWLYNPALVNLTGDAAPEFFVNRLSLNPAEVFEPLSLSPALVGPAPAAGKALAAATADPCFVVDLDGDNQAELVRITTDPTTSTIIRISDRQPDGTFAETLSLEVDAFDPPNISAVEAIDLDADGDLELTVAVPSAKFVFQRVGARGFDPLTIVFPETYGDISWTDLNGDALPDLPSYDGTWQENLGDLSFAAREASPAFALLEFASFKTIVPRPGLAALVHAILPTVDEGYELVSIPFDSKEPVSRQAAPGNVADSPVFLRHADLDGDGLLDLVHSYSTWDHVSWWSRVLAVSWGSPSGFTAPQTLVAAPAYDHRAFAGDFNKDKRPDLILGPDAEGLYRIRLNHRKTGLGDERVIEGLDIPGTSFVVIGTPDIDKDGRPDLVCSHTVEPVTTDIPETAITVARGRRDGTFDPPVLPRGGFDFTPSAINGGDFIDWDRDGDLDLVGGGVWRENVKGSFPAGQRYLVALGTVFDFLGNPTTGGGTITGDLDGDRAPDIISTVYGEGEGFEAPKTMAICYNDGFGGIEAITLFPAVIYTSDSLGNPIAPGAVAIADLNLDGLPDLWIREVTGSDFLGNPVTTDRWLRNPGRGSRDPATWVSQPLPETAVPGVAFADFDGDRKSEWVSPNGYLKPTRSGPLVSETFDFTGGIDLSNNPFHTAADFDGDGDADFIIGGGDSPLLLLQNDLAEERKRRFVQPRPIRWLGQPAVK